MKIGLALGGRVQTDVFELELRDGASGAPIVDRASCTAIAIALRQALARSLGVEPREIGWSTSKLTSDGVEARAITLFDAADGGAGYVSVAGEQLKQLLMDARSFLECPQKCDAACHACLLAFDTQHEAALDRHSGLRVLTESFLAAMALPEALQAFGPDTKMEMQPLTMALLRELRQSSVRECRIFLGDSVEDWIFDEWTLWPHLLRWRADGIHVTLVLPEASVKDLDHQEANALASRAEAAGLDIQISTDVAPSVAGFPLLAEVATDRDHVRWARPPLIAQALAPGGGWGGGANSGTLRVRASGTLPAITGRPSQPHELRKSIPGTFKELTIASQTDGDLAAFGQRFWRLVASQVVGLDQKLQTLPITEVQWNDRYVRSPLVARATYEVLRGLVRPGDSTGLTKASRISLRCLGPETMGRGLGRFADNDWQDMNDQTLVLKSLLGRLANAQVEVADAQSRKRVPHQREIKILFADRTSLVLRPDQGMGFLRPVKAVPFRFDLPADKQAQAVLNASIWIQNDRGPVPIYASGIQGQ